MRWKSCIGVELFCSVFLTALSLEIIEFQNAHGYANNSPARFISCERRIPSLHAFFGTAIRFLKKSQYVQDAKLHEHFKKLNAGEIEDDSDLPLAPENENDPIPDFEEDVNLAQVPKSKKEWSLKKRAHGRRFWHHFFAPKGIRIRATHRYMKFQHDTLACNRVVVRKVTEVHPLIDRRNPDGTLKKLTPKQQRQQKNRFKIERTVVGYDNSGKISNVLMLLNMSTRQLVERVEKVRLPGLLNLRNYEILRLLEADVVYLSTYKNFRNAMDFLLAFGRLNMDYTGDIATFGPVPVKPQKRLRPVIYAVIGKLRNDPFGKHLLKVRRKKAPPVRESFPSFNYGPGSIVNKFLTACESYIYNNLKDAKHDHNETTLRDFSDSFKGEPVYTTRGSVNRIDCPIELEFQKTFEPYLRKPPGSDATTQQIEDYAKSTWSVDDVKEMLAVYKALGRCRPRRLVEKLKSLHNDLGLTYQEIISLVKSYPIILKYGSYKNHCLAIYDSNEGFTFDMVLDMVKAQPQLLTQNIARTIRPKIIYFTRSMQKHVSDLCEFPKALSYSLYERIIPRHMAIMNQHYDGKFLSVYRYLFGTGYYQGEGQLVTDPKVPNLLPKSHAEHLEVYGNLSRAIDLKDMLMTNDYEFMQKYNVSYRDVAIGKEYAYKIPLPSNVV